VRLQRDLAAIDGSYDLVVVGGGITGVCVAREAAGRGLRTLVVDKGDWGSGTSSATSKYLHGGIRYLETYQFALVREALRERRIVSMAAPHLVEPRRFLLPCWDWTRPGRTLLGAGVALYELLAYDKNRGVPPDLRMPHARWLSKRQALAAVPWLAPEGLKGAYAYHDVLNVHAERLLLAMLVAAVEAGATALNHVRVAGFATTAGPAGEVRVDGVELVDTLGGATRRVSARLVVNAGGPWLDHVLAPLGRPLGVGVQRSKGVHVLTRPLGGDDAVLARAPNGRHVIVSPWEGHSLLGPTDTPMAEHPDDVAVDDTDVAEILATVNATSTAALTPDDVESVTVGIRPLVVEDGKDTYTASRRTELYDHGTAGVVGLWSIAGGKWTTSRGEAERIVGRLVRTDELRGRATRRFDSARHGVAGAFGWAIDAEPYLDAAVHHRPEIPVPPPVRRHLARLYGTGHERVLDLVAADPALAAPLSARPGRLDIAAQAVFAVADEQARTLADVTDRRLVLGTLGPLTDDELAAVAGVVAPLLGWDAGRRAEEIERGRARRRAVEALRRPSTPR
jgi:glycerol-3-phosphate dehydrogenase